MSRSPKKANFARRLDFGSTSDAPIDSDDSGSRLKQWKTIRWGRSSETLAVELDSTPKLLRSHRRSRTFDDNPFTSAYRKSISRKETEAKKFHDIFDILPPCPTAHPNPTLQRGGCVSPRICSTSKTRLSVGEVPELRKSVDVLALRKPKPATEVQNTTAGVTNPSSAESFTCLPTSSTGSTSKFSVTKCANQSVVPAFGLSPKFKSPGHKTWKETSNRTLNETCEGKTENSSAVLEEPQSQESPSFVVDTPPVKVRKPFKRKRLRASTKRKEIEESLCNPKINNDCGEDLLSPSFISSPSLLEKPKRRKKTRQKPSKPVSPVPKLSKLHPGTPPKTEKIPDKIGIDCRNLFLASPKDRPVIARVRPIFQNSSKTGESSPKGRILFSPRKSPSSTSCLCYVPVRSTEARARLSSVPNSCSSSTPSGCGGADPEGTSPVIGRDRPRRPATLKMSSGKPDKSPLNPGENSLQSTKDKHLQRVSKTLFKEDSEGDSPDSIIPSSILHQTDSRHSILRRCTPSKKLESSPKTNGQKSEREVSSSVNENFFETQNRSSSARNQNLQLSPVIGAKNKIRASNSIENAKAQICFEKKTLSVLKNFPEEETAFDLSLIEETQNLKKKKRVASNRHPKNSSATSEVNQRLLDLSVIEETQKQVDILKKKLPKHKTVSSPVANPQPPPLFSPMKKKCLYLSLIEETRNQTDAVKKTSLISAKQKPPADYQPLFSPKKKNCLDLSLIEETQNLKTTSPVISARKKRLSSTFAVSPLPSPLFSPKKNKYLDLSLIEETQKQVDSVKRISFLVIEKRADSPSTTASNLQPPVSPVISSRKESGEETVDSMKKMSPALLTGEKRVSSLSRTSSGPLSPIVSSVMKTSPALSVGEKSPPSTTSSKPHPPPSPPIFSLRKKARPHLSEEIHKGTDSLKKTSPALSVGEKSPPSTRSSKPHPPPSPPIFSLRKKARPHLSEEIHKGTDSLKKTSPALSVGEKSPPSTRSSKPHPPPSPPIFSLRKKARPHLSEEIHKGTNSLKKTSPALSVEEKSPPSTRSSNPHPPPSPPIFSLRKKARPHLSEEIHKGTDSLKKTSPALSVGEKSPPSTRSSNPHPPPSPPIFSLRKKARPHLSEEIHKGTDSLKKTSPALLVREKSPPSTRSSKPHPPPSPPIFSLRKKARPHLSEDSHKKVDFLKKTSQVAEIGSPSKYSSNRPTYLPPPSPPIFSLRRNAQPRLSEEIYKEVEAVKKRSPLLLPNERIVDSSSACFPSHLKMTPTIALEETLMKNEPPPGLVVSNLLPVVSPVICDMKKSFADLSVIENTEEQADLLKNNQVETILPSSSSVVCPPPPVSSSTRLKMSHQTSSSRVISDDSDLLAAKQDPIQKEVDVDRKEQRLENESSSPIFKRVGLKPHLPMRACLETQAIDEFDTETLHLAPTGTKGQGWSSEGRITEILSEERIRKQKALENDPQAQNYVAETSAQHKKRKFIPKESLRADLHAARQSVASERRVRAYELYKANLMGQPEAHQPGGKEFQVKETWGRNPMKVHAHADEGEVLLLLGRGLVKNPDTVYPGCKIRIYPPWDVIPGSNGEPTVYLSIRSFSVSFSVLPQDGDKQMALQEVPTGPYRDDPGKMVRALLNLPDPGPKLTLPAL